MAFARHSTLATHSLVIFLLSVAVYLAMHVAFDAHLVTIGIFGAPYYFKYLGL
jgi:hypothetical protein